MIERFIKTLLVTVLLLIVFIILSIGIVFFAKLFPIVAGVTGILLIILMAYFLVKKYEEIKEYQIIKKNKKKQD